MSRTFENPSAAALYQRDWRAKNPDKAAAIQRKSYRKQQVKQANRRTDWRASLKGASEIQRLHARGKDASTIAILLGIRVSSVLKALTPQ